MSNVPIALATSSGEESVAVKTKNYPNLFSLFHHKVMGSSDPEVKEGKPAPDIFLIAAKRFKEHVEPEDVRFKILKKKKSKNLNSLFLQCLVFEDAPNGVKAGRSAGMQVVMVPDPQISEELRKRRNCCLEIIRRFQTRRLWTTTF